jgi:membrane protease YdiL (CAAX protease family)
VFPTVVTWAYFFQAAQADQGVQRTVMATLKVLQFAFPLAWALLVLRDRIDWRRASMRGVPTGLFFGLAVTAAAWCLFHFVLADSPAFLAATEPIRAKVAGFGIDSVTKYVALAAFYSLAHSLLEEYYWRWFVLGRLRNYVSFPVALAISSLAFALHHVIVLWQYFSHVPLVVALFSISVAVGGAVWGAIYERTGHLFGPWMSHLLVDAAIFSVGMVIAWPLLTAG